MLLCALGYGEADEYIGSGWMIQVAKDALPLGIYTGDTAAATNSTITRQQAMLMAYNTLFLPTATPTYQYDMGVRYVTSYVTNGNSLAYSVYGYLGQSTAAAADGKYYGKSNTTVSSTALARVLSTVNGAAGYKWYYKNTTTAVTGFYSSEKVIGSSSAGTALTGANSLTVYSTTNTKYIADLNTPTYYYDGNECPVFDAAATYAGGEYVYYSGPLSDERPYWRWNDAMQR
jgi:hypothetical protein